MRKYFTTIFIFTGILFLLSISYACPFTKTPNLADRQPVFACSFYPSDKSELSKLLKSYFDKSALVLNRNPLAIIVPHAGYVYSGIVAAAGYRQIDRNATFKHVFIIGSSHTALFSGASIFASGDFITPLGRAKVDTLAGWLKKKYKFINDDVIYHAREHSLEVQLPFLQYWLKNPFTIVPIIVGGESSETSKQLASALEPFLNSDNLFVISSDFSHYPGYYDSIVSDSIMAEAVVSNSSKTFLKVRQKCQEKNVPGLETAMCGWSSVLTLLDISGKHPELCYQKILHRNSGDSQYGDKNRVVGYYALGLVQKKTENLEKFALSLEDKVQLLDIARSTISEYLKNEKVPWKDKTSLSPNLLIPAGAFVTLTENGRLRGCIGCFEPTEPLYKIVQSMAIASATKDTRFEPVRPSELNRLKIEISVLTPMRRIKSIEEIELGKHGIYIKKGNYGGTFLPQVATDTGWSKEEFLGHCAQDKASIGWNGWKDAEIFVYEALVFREK
ncbi:MAG: AmmeMemoRadiSam system protein B [Prolixibacteraceae bacterium]